MISLFHIRKTMSWRPNQGVTSAKPERNKEGVGKEGQAITAGLILGLTSPWHLYVDICTSLPPSRLKIRPPGTTRLSHGELDGK
jgi:hypothetical protein